MVYRFAQPSFTGCGNDIGFRMDQRPPFINPWARYLKRNPGRLISERIQFINSLMMTVLSTCGRFGKPSPNEIMRQLFSAF